jgi:hypothetical protein
VASPHSSSWADRGTLPNWCTKGESAAAAISR